MKLLFDQNLSYRLVDQLKELFPGSSHIRLIGLEGADDETIWAHAREHGFAIVTFDYDFYERGLIHGFPPKVLWLRCGNTSTANVLDLLKRSHRNILEFEQDPHSGCLELA